MSDKTYPDSDQVYDRCRQIMMAELPGRVWVNQAAMLYGGSIAHGTWKPSADSIDDIDVFVVYIPRMQEYLHPLSADVHQTFHVQVDEYDITAYEWVKFFRLLASSNPNILNLIWGDVSDLLYRGIPWDGLLAERDLFSTREYYHRVRGYAHSQIERMERSNFHGHLGEKRKELVQRFGYDTKAAAHAVRLLRQGVEFLRTGSIQVCRPDAEELLQIKRGEWTRSHVMNEITVLECQLAIAHDRCSLPERVDRVRVNQLCTRLLSEQWGVRII